MLTLSDLAHLAHLHAEDLHRPVREFHIGPAHFAWNSRPYLMGVLNLSPDSWYRESVCLSADSAIQRGRILHAQGAALLDIGAESSLAHAARADDFAQKSRLLPVIQTLASEGLLVSVETYQPAVAEACLKAGARVLNLTGNQFREDMFRLVANHDAALILCHVQGENVREVSDYDFGADPIQNLLDSFEKSIDLAQHHGVTRILIDPGLGFYYRNLQDSSVRIQHQMRVFLNSFRLRRLGFPVCHALPHAFECFQDEVRSAEPFFAVLAALGQTSLFRTHEVPRTRAVLNTLGLWKSPEISSAQTPAQ